MERPIPVIEWKSKGKDPPEMCLHTDVLHSVLSQAEGRKLAITSIIGPIGTGKSFLMSLIVRYLEFLEKGIGCNEGVEWMFTNEPLQGFPFENSMDLVTSEVQVWPRPFFIGDVALILFDTPGIFESNTSLREWAGIAGTVLSLSSCTIFNIAHNLQEDSLVTLETFIEYGKLLTESNGDTEKGTKRNTLQEVMFLIRDWNNPEFVYGDGITFLEKKLTVFPGMSTESAMRREALKMSIEEMGCFLMPHPEDSELEFGKPLEPEYIDNTFGEVLKNCVVSLFQPTKIKQKLLHGNAISVKDFLQLAQSYVNIFNASFNFPIDTANISIKMHLEMKVIRLVQEYKSYMDKQLNKKSIPNQAYLDKHHKFLTPKLILEFKKKSKCESKTLEQFLVKLNQRIDREFKYFSDGILQYQQSVMSRVEHDTLEGLTAQLKQLTISEQASNAKFEGVWKRALATAKLNCEEKIANLEKPLKEQFLVNVEQQLLKIYEETKARNLAQVESILKENDPALHDAVEIYVDKMELLQGEGSIIVPEKLAASHEIAIRAAQKLFDNKVTVPAAAAEVQEILQRNLSAKLTEKYNELQHKNNQILEATKATLNQEGEILIENFKLKTTGIIDADENPGLLLDRLEKAYTEELESLNAQIHDYEVQGKSLLNEFHQEIKTKLEEVYKETSTTLGAKIKNQLSKEAEIVSACLEQFPTKFLFLGQEVLNPVSCASKIEEEIKVSLVSCKRQLEAVKAAGAQNYIENLTQGLNHEGKTIATGNKQWYEAMLAQLENSQDESILQFKNKTSLKTPLVLTVEELTNFLNSEEAYCLQDYSDKIMIYKLAADDATKLRYKLKDQLEMISQQIVGKWNSEQLLQIQALKSESSEKAISAISHVMSELSKFDLLDEDNFRGAVNKARRDFIAKLRLKLSTDNVSKTSADDVVSATEETIDSSESKHWSEIITKNTATEEIIHGRISDLKSEYFKGVIANMEPRSKISDRLISNFINEFKFSDPRSARRYQEMLEESLVAINYQIDSDEEHALQIELSKQKLLQEFMNKATESESLDEAASKHLIDPYIDSFREITNKQELVDNFRLDLERECRRIADKREEAQKVAEIEKMLELLRREFRSLLEKKGSSHFGSIKQKTTIKFEMAAQKCKFNVSKYRSSMEQSMEQILKEIKEFEKTKVTEEKINQIVEDIIQIYREEMSKHYSTPKYYASQTLRGFHDDAMREALTKVRHARSDAEEIKNRVSEAFNESLKEFDAKNLMNAPKSFAVGIDLGTTYSCVGVYMNGKIEVIPNDIGEKTTPSYVYYPAEGDIVIGEAAKSQSHSNPDRTVYEVKRLIGRDINDSAIKDDLAKWPFRVVSERGIAKVQVGEATVFPEEVSAEILRKLKEIAGQFLNQEITAAVITVPAYFTDGQKAATKRAGEEAGLDVLRIISEPSAAAIAYNLNWAKGQKSTKGLVYDMGGGTFDVALFTATRGDIKIINVGGDAHLGGVDFDNELVNHCCKEFKKSTGIDLLADQDSKDLRKKTLVNRKLMRLKRRCEEYKKALTVAKYITVAIDNIHETHDLEVKVTKSQFEGMIKKYVDASLEIVKNVLTEVQMDKEAVEEIILIGGSTRIPLVQKSLMEFFGKALSTEINPDEAVAVGAAYEAAVLHGKREEARGNIVPAEFAPRGVSTKDVTPMAYGIEIEGGDMCVLIPRRSQVPTQVSRDFVTAYHHQTSVQVVIYEGENPKATENTLVGEFYLNGIPPALAGKHIIRVTMKITPEGMINVAATCIDNGVSKDLTVRAYKKSMGRKGRTGQVA